VIPVYIRPVGLLFLGISDLVDVAEICSRRADLVQPKFSRLLCYIKVDLEPLMLCPSLFLERNVPLEVCEVGVYNLFET
jgi:hypothetical protein